MATYSAIRFSFLCYLQLAWSHDSKKFLIIGNGKNSSIVVYSIVMEESDFTLRELWVLPAKDCPPFNPNSGQRDPTTSAAVLSEERGSTSQDSGRKYPYKNAFFMAEFNPSGNIFAVEELPYQTTMIHLVSPEGRIVKSVDLMAAISEQDSCKRRPVNTVFISAHHCGLYAIGLEGGRMALMEAELLQITKTFKVVWYYYSQGREMGAPDFRPKLCLHHSDLVPVHLLNIA